MHFGFFILFCFVSVLRCVTLWILKFPCCLKGVGQRSMDGGFWLVWFLSRESFWRELKSLLGWSSGGVIKHPLLEGSLLPQTVNCGVFRRRRDRNHRSWSTTRKEYNQGHTWLLTWKSREVHFWSSVLNV